MNQLKDKDNKLDEVNLSKVFDNNDEDSSEEETNFFLKMNKQVTQQTNNESNEKETIPSFLSNKRKVSEQSEESTTNKKKQKKNNKKPLKRTTLGNKKQICQFYINGACKKGDQCPYSHDVEQIKKNELCKFFLTGHCAKGDKCLYSHNLKEFPCKFFHARGFCENLDNCKFSHDRLTAEQLMDFIKDNESFLFETRQKFGRTNMDEFFDVYLKEKKEKNTPDNLMIPDSLKIETKEEEKKDNSKNNNMMNMLPLGFSMIAMNQKLLSQLNININKNIENIIRNTTQNNTMNKSEGGTIPKEETIIIKQEEKKKSENKTIDPFQNPNTIDNSELNDLFF